jgi:DNA-binding protein HU-beta
MNKSSLIHAISEASGIGKSDVKKVLESMVAVLNNGLIDGDKVLLTGFGSFHVVTRSARIGINPKTLKPMDIPAKKFVKFIPGKELAGRIH